MANRTLLAFRRRHNEDGTWDSICLRCFRTAASALDASWRSLLQSTHTCDPMDLHAWMSESRTIWAESTSASPHHELRIGTPADAESLTLRLSLFAAVARLGGLLLRSRNQELH